MFVRLANDNPAHLTVQAEKGRKLKALLAHLEEMSVSATNATQDYEIGETELTSFLEMIGKHAVPCYGVTLSRDGIRALDPKQIDKIYLEVMRKKGSNYIIRVTHPA